MQRVSYSWKRVGITMEIITNRIVVLLMNTVKLKKRDLEKTVIT